MKVSVEENPKNKKEYPYIGIATNNGAIVLFTSQCTGTLISLGESIYSKNDILCRKIDGIDGIDEIKKAIKYPL